MICIKRCQNLFYIIFVIRVIQNYFNLFISTLDKNLSSTLLLFRRSCSIPQFEKKAVKFACSINVLNFFPSLWFPMQLQWLPSKVIALDVDVSTNFFVRHNSFQWLVYRVCCRFTLKRLIATIRLYPLLTINLSWILQLKWLM